MTNTHPLFLLTNDDGINAPGLLALCKAMLATGKIEVVAPDRQRSAAGHAVSVDRNMTYHRQDLPSGILAHVLDGTPADCVKLALTRLLPCRPVLVISGINSGANIGNNILYSGTVAAAIEAVMLGVPAIAVSLHHSRSGEELRYDTAAAFCVQLSQRVLTQGLPPGIVLNVNVPNVDTDEIRGVVISRQGRSMYLDVMEPIGENGRVLSFRNVGQESVPSSGSDDFDDLVLERGMISITPLHYDLTHHSFREEMQGWFL